MLPSNPNFNPRDAQARQLLFEAGALVKTIHLKTGQEYIGYLQSELPGLGWNEATTQAYLEALVSSDLRKFRQYFQVGARHSTLATDVLTNPIGSNPELPVNDETKALVASGIAAFAGV